MAVDGANRNLQKLSSQQSRDKLINDANHFIDETVKTINNLLDKPIDKVSALPRDGDSISHQRYSSLKML